MYSVHSKRVVNLWCECGDNDEESGPPKSKHRQMTRRREKEGMVDEIVQELKEKYDKSFGEPRHRLWACMIVTGAHSSKDAPPKIPMFCGIPSKRKAPKVLPEESIITAAAAAAITKVVTVASPQTTIVNSQSPLSVAGVSPGRTADIWGRSCNQLSN